MPCCAVYYENEPVIGISAARNHALEYAIRQDFDLLVFVDDDEYVAVNWLVELLAERDRRDLDIVGSPVRPAAWDDRLTPMQKLVLSGIKCGSRKSEAKCRWKCDTGIGHTIKVATGSWMGRVDFFRTTGLRFEMRFGLTGGEDWNLWLHAKRLGAASGWACDAIAYEIVPTSRLTLAYHFRRNRDHNITEYAARYSEDSSMTIRKLPVKITGRTFKLFAAICTLPVRGSHGLVSTAEALGGLVGIIQGSVGMKSLHYAKTTGF